jgi:hypothetical protein
MTKVPEKTESAQFQGHDAVAIVVEALGVLETRDGFQIPATLVEERARNVIEGLRGSFAIVKIGPLDLGSAIAHLDAASAILVGLEGSV